jgi:5-methyltetrahydrofolate--homocysteine methyltransferase
MLTSITDAIRDGDIYDIAELVQSSLDSGSDPQAVLHAMTDGLDQCGSRFEAGEFFLPELMMAGEAFTEGMGILEPHLVQSSMGQEGRVVLGTVAGDVHDIGKNLVGFLLKSAGFEVIDLHTDNSTEDFIQALKAHRPDVLGLSALLTTTMLGMGDVIRAMDEEGLREKTRVIIGGGPVSERFAQQIGADAYASDAVEGVRKIRELVAASRAAAH